MLKIYVARHGQDEDNASGILNGRRNKNLTAIGIGQAKELAAGILDTGIIFDCIYSSPLSRAYETAKIVADALGTKEPEILEDLIERDFGIMTGKATEDIETLCAPDIMKTKTMTYFLSPSGAEIFPGLMKRASRVLTDIRAKHNDGAVLLVTHGDIGKMLYAAYYDLDWTDVLTAFHFGNSELLLLAEDSKPENSRVTRIKQHNH